MSGGREDYKVSKDYPTWAQPIVPLQPPQLIRLGQQTPEPTSEAARRTALKDGVKFDGGKAHWWLLPFRALEGVVRVFMFGAKKYSTYNWRKGMAYSRVTSAAMRHIVAYMDGVDVDEESGEHPIDHAICELLFLREYIRTNTGTDDRFKIVGVDG